MQLVSIAEQEHMVSELSRVLQAPADEQMQVLNWAMQYADAYYMDAHGALRRVFPKGKLLKPRRRHAVSES